MEKEFEREKPSVEETLDVVVHTIDRLEIGQMEMRDEMRAGFKLLTGELSVVKSDVSTLKFDVHELKSDVSVLKSDVAILKSDVRRLDDKTDRIEAKLDDVAETLAESVEDHERRLVVLEAKV